MKKQFQILCSFNMRNQVNAVIKKFEILHFLSKIYMNIKYNMYIYNKTKYFNKHEIEDFVYFRVKFSKENNTCLLILYGV